MPSLHRSEATVGFYADDLDPAEITTCLGADPTIGVRKGNTWLTRSGAEKVAGTGFWRIEADRREPADLDGQITEVLARLSDDLVVWRGFASRFRGVVFCGLFMASGNEGVTLRPETLTAIGERGLVLDLDIYAQDE